MTSSGSGQLSPALRTLQRLAHRRRRQPGPPGDLVLGNPGKLKRKISRTWRMETLSAGIDPLLGQSQRADPTHSQRRLSAIPVTPGDIIPESWARINRNAGRQLIGIGGRHHLGIDGRLAPEFAHNGQNETEQPDHSVSLSDFHGINSNKVFGTHSIGSLLFSLTQAENRLFDFTARLPGSFQESCRWRRSFWRRAPRPRPASPCPDVHL